MSGVDRRTLLAGGLAAGLTTRLSAAELAVPVPIWPGVAPGAGRVRVTEREIPRSPTGPADDTAFVNVTRPSLAYAAPARPNGSALLLIPGGGYRRVAIGRGGRGLMTHFADQGFHTYLLKYRLPADGWAAGPDAPLQDAQRALRLIRSQAGAKGFAPDRIGAMGFSAGGHLAAMLAYRADATYPPVDAVDRQPLGLKAAALLYPVALMGAPGAHRPSQTELLGKSPSPELASRHRTDARVTAVSPPTFLAHAIDDKAVPVDNTLALLAALRRAGVPAEAHLPEIGGHGFGLTGPDGSPLAWPGLFVAWAKRHGLG